MTVLQADGQQTLQDEWKDVVDGILNHWQKLYTDAQAAKDGLLGYHEPLLTEGDRLAEINDLLELNLKEPYERMGKWYPSFLHFKNTIEAGLNLPLLTEIVYGTLDGSVLPYTGSYPYESPDDPNHIERPYALLCMARRTLRTLAEINPRPARAGLTLTDEGGVLESTMTVPMTECHP